MGKKKPKGETFAERVNREIRESGGARVSLSTPEENARMNSFIRGEKAAGEGVLDAAEFFGSEEDREEG